MDRPSSSLPWDELLERADFLRALARALVRDVHRAEDVVQDAFVAALEHPPRDARAATAFVARTVRRLASNAARGERRRGERERASAGDELQEPERLALERMELQRELLELVLALREPYRTALYLRYYEGRSPREIARLVGVPVATAKTRLARALAALRARLDERSEGGRGAWTAAMLPFAFPSKAAGAPVATLVGGALVTKPIALAALALVLAALVWSGFARRVARPSGSMEPGAPGTVIGPSAEPAPLARPLPERASRSADDERTSLAPTEGPPTGALEVELAWSDGRPASGVALDARCENDPAPREERFGAVTDAEGHARFPALFAGEVALELERGARFEVEVGADATTTRRFEMPSGLDVEGRVVDPSGAPVPGAEIWIEGSRRLWPNGRRIATSGADGRFVLRALDGDARFGARAKGFQASPLFEASGLPLADSGARTIELPLGEPGGRVTGRVVDASGSPVAGALVEIGPRGEFIVDLPNGLRGSAASPVPIATDAEGRFEYPGDLPPGAQPVHATARGYPVLEREVEVVAGSAVALELALERPASIEGRVVDAQGAPVAGARVIAAEEVGGGWFFHAFPPPEAKTDGEGRFRLGWIAPGMQELNARDWRRARLGKARAVVECRAGETSTCELALELGRTIEGRVVDREGRPLAGWTVHGDPKAMGFVYPRQDATDDEGRFVLANLGDCAFDLALSGPGEFPIPPRMEIERVQPGARDVEFVVEEVERKQGRVRGVLLGADGRAPADVELVLYPVGGSSGGFVEFDARTGAFDHGPSAAGHYLLSAMRGGLTLFDSAEFTIEDGRTTDVGVLRIEAQGAIEIAVKGVPETELGRLRFALDRSRHGTIEPALEGGRFVARELAPGTWILRSRNESWCLRDAEVDVRAGETARVELEGSRGVVVRFVCDLPDGASAFGEIALEVRDEAGKLVRRAYPYRGSADKGRVRLPDVALGLGTYVIEARTDTGLGATERITLAADPSAPREFELALR